MGTPVMTPVGAVVRGLAAGAVGTLAMDLLLFARYKRGDGKSGFRTWELSAEIESWEQAPAPAQVGKRLFEGLFQRDLPDRLAPLVNNITHWGYGILGAQYGLLVGSLRTPRVWFGRRSARGCGARPPRPPAAGLYQPIWSTTGERSPTISAPISSTGSPPRRCSGARPRGGRST